MSRRRESLGVVGLLLAIVAALLIMAMLIALLPTPADI